MRTYGYSNSAAEAARCFKRGKKKIFSIGTQILHEAIDIRTPANIAELEEVAV
jgi:hypothetical protein